MLRPRPSGWGYLQVSLYKDGAAYTKSVHRLVAEAFVPGEDVGLEVNHIDGDKSNNVETNLEWATKRMNNQHAYDTGLRSSRKTAVRIPELNLDFPTVTACAEYLGTWPTVVSSVITGRRATYKGYTIVKSS